jgi:hypothetical protein
MKNIFFVFTILFSATLLSQNLGGIKGKVTDKAMNNEPMLFANVQLKGFDTYYETNFHGNFEISEIEAGEYTLVISYAGYESQELNIVVSENKISQVKTNLSPIQISFDDVEGLDTASKEEINLP